MATNEQHNPPGSSPPDWHVAAAQCLKHAVRIPVLCSPWERGFLASLLKSTRSSPSQKQTQILDNLVARCALLGGAT